MSHVQTPSLILVLFLFIASTGCGDDGSVFGKSQESEAALIGIMYDLKQTQLHQPTNVTPWNYGDVVEEFLAKDWDEAVLNRYYRVSRPLYTTQIFVPDMDADEAPKAFGAQKTVKPLCWLIHYKGQVSAPALGKYRFWGCADDALSVAVDGKTELINNMWVIHSPAVKWKASEPDGAQAADNHLRPGDWFTLTTGQIIDLDVIIGERPGGSFNAFLLIEKQGEVYPKDASGCPIFPIFQVANYNTPARHQLNVEPLFSAGFPPWKCYQ